MKLLIQMKDVCDYILAEANLGIKYLSDELAQKVDVTFQQQEEITNLLAQVVDLQSSKRKVRPSTTIFKI